MRNELTPSTDSAVASGATYVYRVAAYNVAVTNCTRHAATVIMP